MITTQRRALSTSSTKNPYTMQMAVTDSGFEAKRKYTFQAILFISFTLVSLILFRTFPHVDIYVSQLVFEEKPCDPGSASSIVCGWFPFQFNDALNAARKLSLRLPFLLITGVVVYLLYQLTINPRTTGLELKKSGLVIWTLLIGTVGIINLVLKEIWGRPRPFEVEVFGGKNPFVLPGTIAEYCDRNCSFTSGEASSAAWLFTLLVFVPRGWRALVGIMIAAYVIFFSGLRVAVGKHFLSDVTISILITLSVFFVLRAVFQTERITDWFDRLAGWSNQLVFDRWSK